GARGRHLSRHGNRVHRAGQAARALAAAVLGASAGAGGSSCRKLAWRVIATDSVLRSGWSGPSDSALVTVLLVRHAEKNTAMLGHDVPLSDGGRRRAQTLARVA